MSRLDTFSRTETLALDNFSLPLMITMSDIKKHEIVGCNYGRKYWLQAEQNGEKTPRLLFDKQGRSIGIKTLYQKDPWLAPYRNRSDLRFAPHSVTSNPEDIMLDPNLDMNTLIQMMNMLSTSTHDESLNMMGLSQNQAMNSGKKKSKKSRRRRK